MKNKNIMIVEDNTLISEDIKSILLASGYNVSAQLSSGEAAIESVRKAQPSLILMDINLSEKMDGIEAAEIINSEYDIPIIYLTAHSDRGYIDRSKKTAPYNYILKPFEERELIIAVDMALYKHNIESKLKETNRQLEIEAEARKEAEKKITDQNTFLNTVLESLTHTFIVIDAEDYSIIMANSASGFTNHPDKNYCYSLTHYRDKPCCGDDHPCPAQKVKETGKPFTTEHIHYDRNGLQRTVEVHGYPIFDSDGKIIQIIEYSLDITERKTAEEALKESEKKYRNIFENAAAGICHSTLEGIFIDANDKFCNIIGYDKNELAGMHFKDITHPDDIALDMEHVNQILNREISTYTIEKRYIRKDEGIIWISLTVSLVKKLDDTPRYFIGIIHDITDRKTASETLRQSEERYRTLVETSPDTIILTDLEGKYLTANNQILQLLGYTSMKELFETNTNGFSFIIENDRKRASSFALKIIKTGISSRDEFKAQKSDGTIIDIELYASLITDNEGAPQFFMSVIRDITERKKAEEFISWDLTVKTALTELSKDLISPDLSIEEIAKKVLHHAMQLTGSSHGFTSSIDPETGDNIGHTLTEMMEDGCAISGAHRKIAFSIDPDGIYPGLWGHTLNNQEPFFTNDPGTHESSRGVPDGHVPLHNFLTVPVVLGDRLLGQIALSNKDGDYSKKDLDIIKRIAGIYALAIQRLHYEDSIVRANEILEEKVKSRTEALYLLNEKLLKKIEDNIAAQENIEKSEKRFRELFNNMSSGVAIYDITGEKEIIIRDINQAGEMMSNVVKKDIVDRHVKDIFPAIEEFGLYHIILKVWETGNPEFYPTARYEDEQLSGWFENYVYKLPAGQVVAIYDDVTEKKNAENILRLSEEKFRTVADFTYDWEYWIDPTGRYIYVSPSCFRITGFTPNDFMSNKNLMLQITHPGDREAVREHIQDPLHENDAHPLDFRIIRKDGSIRYIAHICQPVYSSDGDFLGKRGSNRDVTEQRHIEIKLSEGEAVAQALINTPTDAFLLINTDGTIISYNKAFIQHMGIDDEFVQLQSIHNKVNKEFMGRWKRKISKVQKTLTPVRFEENYSDKWYDTVIYPIKDTGGSIKKVALLSRDITETRRLQKEIMEISELERKRIGQDLHDGLGQKLTGIAFLSEALKQTMAEKNYEEISDINDILENVTDSIEQARKISSGLWTSRLHSYDLVEALLELAADTEIIFNTRCLLNFSGDTRIKNSSIVENFYLIARESINNAIKHGKADIIEINLYDDNDTIYMDITDNGSGSGNTLQTNEGIGLRIMKYRVTVLGGSLEIHNTDNGFTIKIKLGKEKIIGENDQ